MSCMSMLEFLDDSSFRLLSPPFPSSNGEIPLGLYELPRRTGEAHLYRLNHPLAEALLAQAKERELPVAEVRFDYHAHKGKVTAIEPLLGKAGWLHVSLFTVESMDQAEDHVIPTALTDDGTSLDEEAARRLLTLPATVTASSNLPTPPYEISPFIEQRQSAIRHAISDRNARFFESEAAKLESWADDLKLGLEREIKEMDRQIKEARRSATAALSLEEKLAAQKQIRALESQRNAKRKSLFEAQDQVDAQRDRLIASVEGKLAQKSSSLPLFTIRWILG